ncbi:MAG TPA: hypothetical protein VF622_14605 [Segetibacter sp.]|jgi:hypothetical protein
MSFRNSIIFDRGSKIKLDTSGEITLEVQRIKKIGKYTCPLQTKDITKTDEWEYKDYKLTVDDPGRYLIEYE